MGALREEEVMESRLCILLISISALYFASATDQEAADVNAIVPESFVEEEPTTVKITRECFEKSCMHGQGHEECRMHKMPCAPSDKAQTPWAMFIEPQTKRRSSSAWRLPLALSVSRCTSMRWTQIVR